TASTQSRGVGTDQPINVAEFQRMRDFGLAKRGAADESPREIDVPITSDQYTKMSSLGLDKCTTDVSSLSSRESRDNCAVAITTDGYPTGRKQSGGNGVWCPLDQYLKLVEQFRRDYAKDPTATGPAGNFVFDIFNTKVSPTYVVVENDCKFYMEKQSHVDSRCYGAGHDDTSGGYWKVDKVGLFGSEVPAESAE
ncbi:MAG: hypothetical protein Q9192_007357, partial [Flavoplaca navasiana]